MTEELLQKIRNLILIWDPQNKVRGFNEIKQLLIENELEEKEQ